MHVLVYLVAYLAIAVFAVAVAARFVMFSKTPIHLRWELYPVAHEGSKAAYGGSFMEDSDWWSKPREFSLFNEIKAMFLEIVFLVALREHNPKLWTRSFPFHFGLYLIFTCVVLSAGAGLLGAVAPGLLMGPLGSLLKLAIWVVGVGGMVLGFVGALGLLQRRAGTRELREYAAPADIFNLAFFVVAFGVSLLTFLTVDRDLSLATHFVANLVTFNLQALPATGLAALLPALTVLLLSALLAYIPLTHMSHFVGKYFAYHAIRWNDTPNLPGTRDESQVNEMLGKPISWAAPHIKGDGKKTWAQVATEEMEK